MSPTWEEYDSAARWCAERGHTGELGSPLPNLVSTSCMRRINYDPDKFSERVSEWRYMLSRGEREPLKDITGIDV